MSEVSLSPTQIGHDLKKRINGKVAVDEISRYFYSTDASIYRIPPQGVVYPKDKKDVIAVIKYAHEHNIPVHARGAGSGLGGASLGSGIVIAFRRYMNKILEIDEKEACTIVQPGVICGNLNHELAKIGKIVYVDNSSENYASIGGMIGTNSSGAHAVKYGYMADYVKSLTVILSNGEEIETHPVIIGSEEFNTLTAKNTLEAELYKSMLEIAKNPDVQARVLEKWPKVKMNVSGYNIKDVIQDVIKDNRIDLSRLFLGSEGTLGVVVEAKLKFIDKPIDKTLVVMDFDSLAKSGKAVDLIVKQIGVAAIEVLGKSVLEIGVQMNPALKEFIPSGVDNILYIEFDEQDPNIRAEKVKKTRELIIDQEKLSEEMRFSDDPVEQNNLWKVRKDAVPLLQKVREPRRIMAFVEDQTVPLEHLGSYMTHLQEEIFPKYDVRAAIYGHASKGLVHTRPFVNTKDPHDLELISKIAGDVNSYVISIGGSISGEHNDGWNRVNYIKQMYGEELYKTFKEMKILFDPKSILNPDNKITDKENLLVSNLRFGAEYSTTQELKENILWNEQWGFQDVIESCHGCGKCTVTLIPQRDCPIYRAKQESTGELSSPRARANLMRGIISGQLDQDILYTKEAREVLEDCGACMMCNIDCPSGVNIPKVMFDAKILHYKNSKLPYIGNIPKGHYFTGSYETIAKIGSFFSPLSNLGLWGPNKLFMQLFGGVHRKANFPNFTRNTFQKWFKKHSKKNPAPSNPKKKVAIFHGCFANYTENRDIAVAHVQVLEKNGIEVVVPKGQNCCGIPLLANGLGQVAQKKGKNNAKIFAKYVDEGYDVVTQCSSCYATLKDELHETLVGNEDSLKVRDNAYLFSEYILKLKDEGILDMSFTENIRNGKSFGYHEPCHLLSTGKKGISVKMLQSLESVNVTPLKTECCGQLGSWGFKAKNYKYGQVIAERSLYPEAKRDDIDALVTDCPTCKLQLQNVKKDIYHPTQVLRDAYGLEKP
ncbi:MAG: FAD-linked oxidase C-terminal domain-containing protein [Candidatus Hodarchaeales archaeon]|jgi:FAD/FMN-containing dehydrogenase/Fe-S oxidoreductase